LDSLLVPAIEEITQLTSACEWIVGYWDSCVSEGMFFLEISLLKKWWAWYNPISRRLRRFSVVQNLRLFTGT